MNEKTLELAQLLERAFGGGARGGLPPSSSAGAALADVPGGFWKDGVTPRRRIEGLRREIDFERFNAEGDERDSEYQAQMADRMAEFLELEAEEKRRAGIEADRAMAERRHELERGIAPEGEEAK